jgi:hypothetical protein
MLWACRIGEHLIVNSLTIVNALGLDNYSKQLTTVEIQRALICQILNVKALTTVNECPWVDKNFNKSSMILLTYFVHAPNNGEGIHRPQ